MIDTTVPSITRELPPGFCLFHGAHTSFDQGACLMEAVAYIAGEPHSDHPECASPILASIGRALNDRLRDDERQLLAPMIPRLVGTRAHRDVEKKRAYAMVDAAIRELAPMGLDAVKWSDLADRMRAVAPIVDRASAEAALKICSALRDEARRRRAAYAFAFAFADAVAVAYAVAAVAAYAADADAVAVAAAYAVAAAADVADAVAAAADVADADARRSVVEATIRAFERVIAIAA